MALLKWSKLRPTTGLLFSSPLIFEILWWPQQWLQNLRAFMFNLSNILLLTPRSLGLINDNFNLVLLEDYTTNATYLQQKAPCKYVISEDPEQTAHAVHFKHPIRCWYCQSEQQGHSPRLWAGGSGISLVVGALRGIFWGHAGMVSQTEITILLTTVSGYRWQYWRTLGVMKFRWT